jgi:hypothetical protein
MPVDPPLLNPVTNTLVPPGLTATEEAPLTRRFVGEPL